MVQKVQVILVDDIDGGEARETVSFALDGISYEIDLSETNADKLREDFASWIGHARRANARKIGSGRRSAPAAAAGTGRRDLNAVREWGRSNGFQVSDRGRVSRELQDAYDAAH